MAILLTLGLAGCAAAEVNLNISGMNTLLGSGVNFGNALEAPNEGDWGMTLQPEYFSLVKQAGFKTIRLPVSWTTHAAKTAPYTVDPKFFERVDWAINQAMSQGLNIIINVHHYDELNADPVAETQRYLAIWKQIAERYKDRPSTVYFELLNEPHGKFNDAPQLWNDLLAKALAVVRQSNSVRPVIVGPVSWNSIWQLPKLKLPDDPNLIVTVHYYDPMTFTHQGAGWIQPMLPTGVTWSGDARTWASGWADWSWDSTRRFVDDGGKQKLELTYTKGYGGLYLHSDVGAQGYTALAFKANRAANLLVKCMENKVDKGSKALTTQDGWHDYTLKLSDCGSPDKLTDLFIQNNTNSAQPPILLDDLELRGPSGTLALLSTEKAAVQGALDYAAKWSQDNNRPIFLGEFGAYEKADLDSRVLWTATVRSEAEKRGFSWAYWEFGAGFGIYDRTAKEWRLSLLKALVPKP